MVLAGAGRFLPEKQNQCGVMEPSRRAFVRGPEKQQGF